MLQTFWELNRQNIRKLTDTAMGIVVGYGAFAGEWTPVYLGIVGLLLNYLWFWLDNRAKVTVKGLEAASKMGAAVAVEKAIDAVKAKKA